jgi:hypothetical protein
MTNVADMSLENATTNAATGGYASTCNEEDNMPLVPSNRTCSLLLAGAAALLASACTYVERDRTPPPQAATVLVPQPAPTVVQPAPAPTVTVRPSY